MKKIILIILLLITTNVSYSQLKIGPRLTIRDSSGTAVLNGKLKTWASNYIFTKDLDSSVAGIGISYSINSGLTINAGTGIKIINDTLYGTAFTGKYDDSINIAKNLTDPKLRFTNTNSNIAYIKLNEQNLMTLEPNRVSILGLLNATQDLAGGRDVYAYSNFKIGDLNSSFTIADDAGNLFANQLRVDNSDSVILYIDNLNAEASKSLDGTGTITGTVGYFGGGLLNFLTEPDIWIRIKFNNNNYLMPIYNYVP